MSTILRREFLWRMASVLSLPLIGSGTIGCGEVDSGPSSDARPDQAALHYTSGARLAAETIGEAYLAEVAPNRDPKTIEPIAASIEALVSKADSESDAIEQLQESVRQDFVALRIHRLEGWTLSQTELAICALVALDTNRAA